MAFDTSQKAFETTYNNAMYWDVLKLGFYVRFPIFAKQTKLPKKFSTLHGMSIYNVHFFKLGLSKKKFVKEKNFLKILE